MPAAWSRGHKTHCVGQDSEPSQRPRFIEAIDERHCWGAGSACSSTTSAIEPCRHFASMEVSEGNHGSDSQFLEGLSLFGD
jgi:hypothetical protein